MAKTVIMMKTLLLQDKLRKVEKSLRSEQSKADDRFFASSRYESFWGLIRVRLL